MSKKASLFILFVLFFAFFSYTQPCIDITTQPQNQLVLDNNDIQLNVEALSVENLSYQWQVFNSDINVWEDISDGVDYNGTNTNTLTITNVMPSINGAQFQLIINGQTVNCNEISDPVIIRYVEIIVNNVFTPNDDGFNDFFTINGITNSEFRDSKLQIYSRWGNLVYEKIGYQNNWDGVATSGITVNGSKKLPAGTYFYTIDLNYDNKKFSGWIYIVR